MQKLITLAIAAAMIYVIIDAKRAVVNQQQPQQTEAQAVDQPPADPNAPAPEIEGGILERSASKVLINVLKSPEGRSFLEKIVRPANSPVTGKYTIKVNEGSILKELMKIETMAEGEGPQASCGHVVTVNYEVINMQRVIMESGTKTFTLGSHDMIPGLSDIIVGMRKGEVRKAIVPKLYAYDAPNFKGKQPSHPTEYYQISAKLITAIPDNFADNNVKIFDSEVAYVVPYLCGDRVTFNAKIMKINGDVVYNSATKNQPITMNIGDNSYPMIFSHALFNKTEFGTRTVICKGQHLHSLFSKEANKIFPKSHPQPNENEFFLIEFNNLPHENNATKTEEK